MRIVFFGTGDFGGPVLRSLPAAGHEIIAAVSQPDRPAGRGRAVRPTPIHATAGELGLRHIQAEDINAVNLEEVVGAAEIGVVVAFGQKIGAAILDALPRGCVNIHGSLLPKYRGAAPIQWALINGDETTGVTVFQLNERWDAGAVWSRRSIPIRETETAEELHDRLAELGAGLIVDTLADIEAGRAKPKGQDVSQATRAPKLSKADGRVDWSQPARRVVRRIHGLWSWPAAACLFASRNGKQERVLLARAEVADQTAAPTDEFPPGAFCDDLTVQAGTGRVRLLEVRPAGKKLMPFEAFANGRRITPPDRLLPVEV
ncbi:MAG: methionyl-tRNA formyltransferase [Phycisphaerae bacterium]|nr:methionyl-tRNA formyltransferase [Phycisphaerae bacterium]